MAAPGNGCDEGGSLTGRKRRLAAVPGEADPHTDTTAAATSGQGRPQPASSRRERRGPAPLGQTVASAENATSIGPEPPTARPRGIPAKRERVPPLAAVTDGKRLGVRPAAFLPGTEERRAQARQALTVLYRDFVAGGGLDLLRDRRLHAPPAHDAHERRAA